MFERLEENSEKLENKIDSINENSKKQNKILSENLIKLMNEKFDKNKEETDEYNWLINERLNQINERPVSYTHLDVYKRQNDESLRQIQENNKQRDERIENNNKELRQIINEQNQALREVINERIANVNETLNKRVDDYEEEVRQQITETKVGLEKTDETIVQLRVEVEAKINQVENRCV